MKGIEVGRLGIVVAAMLLTGGAWAAVGSGELSGKHSLKVPKCGSDGSSVSVDLSLLANGTFSGNWEGQTFTGTQTTNGRVTTLSMDAGSQTLLGDALEPEISDLCSTTVTVTSVTITQAQLKLNKTQTSAKMQFKAGVTGNAGNGSGQAKYQLKASGSWSPAL